MAKKLIFSLVITFTFIVIFTLNAFAVAVPIPVVDSNYDPAGDNYMPQSAAFMTFVYSDAWLDSNVEQRYVANVPIVNPTTYTSFFSEGQYPNLSDYRLGDINGGSHIQFETNIDEFTMDNVGAWVGDSFIGATVAHQDYSGYMDIDSIIAGYPVFGLWIPKMLVWNESISSAYGINSGNSINISINNYINYLFEPDYFESGICSIRLYGTDDSVRCKINLDSFFRFDEDTQHYWFDFDLTWDMLNGAEVNGKKIIELDDSYEGMSVIDYFTDFYQDTDIFISESSIFEIVDVDIYLSTYNPDQFHVLVDTCDRRDLNTHFLSVNRQSIDVPIEGYTNFVVRAVHGFLTTQILPGFTFGGILLVMIAFCLVMWFLKFFAGG